MILTAAHAHVHLDGPGPGNNFQDSIMYRHGNASFWRGTRSIVKFDESCSFTLQPQCVARSRHTCGSLWHRLIMNLEREILSAALTRSCNELPSFFNLCWLYPHYFLLKAHGTAWFPRVCLPSHQAKVSSAWLSGLWGKLPKMSKSGFRAKGALKRCILWSKMRCPTPSGSPGGQNWVSKLDGFNAMICGSMVPHGEEVPFEFRLSLGLSSASGFDLLQPSRV